MCFRLKFPLSLGLNGRINVPFLTTFEIEQNLITMLWSGTCCYICIITQPCFISLKRILLLIKSEGTWHYLVLRLTVAFSVGMVSGSSHSSHTAAFTSATVQFLLHYSDLIRHFHFLYLTQLVCLTKTILVFTLLSLHPMLLGR